MQEIKESILSDSRDPADEAAEDDNTRPRTGNFLQPSVMPSPLIRTLSLYTVDDAGNQRPSRIGPAVNLVCNILGAGILALPNCFAYAGVLPGCLQLVIVALLADFSLNLLLDAAARTGCATYERLAVQALGSKWGVRTGLWAGRFVKLFTLLLNVGGTCALFVVVGDSIPPALKAWFGDSIWLQRERVVIFCAVFLVFPLCIPKNINSLRYASAASVSLILAIGICVAGLCFFIIIWGDGEAPGDTVTTTWAHAFASVPVFLLSFFTHLSFIPVYVELIAKHGRCHAQLPYTPYKQSREGPGRLSSSPEDSPPSSSPEASLLTKDQDIARCTSTPTPGTPTALGDPEGGILAVSLVEQSVLDMAIRRDAQGTLRVVVHQAIFVVTMVYLAVGVLGYLACGTQVPSDVLTYHKFSYAWFNVIRMAYGVSILFAFPIFVVVARRSLEDILFHEPAGFRCRAVESAVIVTVAATVSIIEPDLGVVFGLAGAVTGFFLAWILPAAIHLALAGTPWHHSATDMVAVLLLVLGLVGITFGTALYAAVEVF